MESSSNPQSTPRICDAALLRRKPLVLRHIDAWKLEAKFYEMSGSSCTIHSKEAVAHLARYLGFAPSEQEVNTFFQRVHGRCDLAAFGRFCSLLVHNEDKFDTFRELFLVYDRERTGKVKKRVVRLIFCNLGEPLCASDWQRFEKYFRLEDKGDEDLVSYDPLVKKLLDLPE